MAWQCDKCGKMNPNTTGNCIYCGAWDGGGHTSIDGKTKKEVTSETRKTCIGCILLCIIIATIFIVALILFV